MAGSERSAFRRPLAERRQSGRRSLGRGGRRSGDHLPGLQPASTRNHRGTDRHQGRSASGSTNGLMVNILLGAAHSATEGELHAHSVVLTGHHRRNNCCHAFHGDRADPAQPRRYWPVEPNAIWSERNRLSHVRPVASRSAASRPQGAMTFSCVNTASPRPTLPFLSTQIPTSTVCGRTIDSGTCTAVHVWPSVDA